jgi:phosphoketolase
LQVALIIDTLKPEFIIAATVRHSFSALALPKNISTSSNTLTSQTNSQLLYSCLPGHKAIGAW